MEDDIRERNIRLILRLKSGDEEALDELVRINAGLVRSIVQRFEGRGTESEDLIQLGNIGLIRAARAFDLSFGTAFSTYAVPLISGEIKRFLRDDGIVKVSRELQRRSREVAKKQAEFTAKHQREPKISELAAFCGLSAEETAEALCASYDVRSLSETVGEGDTLTLESQIEDSFDRIDSLTDNIALAEAISSLDSEQRRIVSLRFVRCLSQQKTGELLGVSQVKISREEKKILTKLRQAL